MKSTSCVKLAPVIKDYLWGGRRLITDFNKKTDLDKAAESWELSTHPDGESHIASGEFGGMTLSEYITANGRDCLGTAAEKFEFFPMLIKLIDARDNLSIQVHPDDEYARRVEGEYGKTEMWYVVDCDEGAYLYYGVNTTVTEEEFARSIKDNTVLDILNKVPVRKGDVFFIPSGTIHAICAGTLICEVQQNSNTTYRVYDYDRRDKNGRPRALHIDKAIETARLSPSPEQPPRIGNMLASCKYFTVEKADVNGSRELAVTDRSFYSLVIIGGCGELRMNDKYMPLAKGDSIFIPAQAGAVTINGNMEGILSYIS